jgi:hypothetical protein
MEAGEMASALTWACVVTSARVGVQHSTMAVHGPRKTTTCRSPSQEGVRSRLAPRPHFPFSEPPDGTRRTGRGRPAPGCASTVRPDVLLDRDHSGHGETMNRAVVGVGAGRRELAGVRARTLERRHDRRVRVECHRVDDIAREPHPRDQCVHGDRHRVGREEIIADVDRVGARHRAAATAGGCAAAARRTWRHADDPRGSGRRSAACRRHNYRHECRDYREIPHPHPPLHQDESTKTNAPGRKQYSARFPAHVHFWGERQFPRGGRCRKSLNFTLAEASRIAAEQAGSSFQQSE